MAAMERYLDMQRSMYDTKSKQWSLKNKNPVVGSYHVHNKFTDYDTCLFPQELDTKPLVALEYGCGPARNVIRFKNRFKRVDGVDICPRNIANAIVNLDSMKIPIPRLFVNDGKNIPTDASTYDVVFSVITLQHIPCWTLRNFIMTECYRVLRSGGWFCFQIPLKDERPNISDYHADTFDAAATNGKFDVRVDDPEQLTTDLSNIGFSDIRFLIRPPGPGAKHHWLWVHAFKE